MRTWSRRRLLVVTGQATAGLAVAGCATSSAQPEPHREAAKTVDVGLDAVAGEVDLGAGVRASTWSYGGLVPGKEIRVNAGDRLRVRLRNRLPAETSVHWHGVATPNAMDGVPHLTQHGVAPSAEFDYDFTVPHPGTYWFHPHVGVQLDRGLYAPLIVQDPDERVDYDDELVVVLDDWLDGLGRDPDQAFADLRASGAAHAGGGHHGSDAGTSVSPLFEGPADGVVYPHYLANGRVAADPQVVQTQAGKRIRLRLINAGADTAFRVAVPGSRMTVTHTDGFPVRPTAAPSVLLGMGERVDAVIEAPQDTTPVFALPEGKDGHAQVLLQVAGKPAPDPMAVHHMVMGLPVLMAADLTATDAVRLPERTPDVTHELVLNGPQENYAWTINGRVHDPAVTWPVRSGQFVRLVFANMSRMFHPMHLHGHTFQVRGVGGAGPRKDTLIVLPGQVVEVDFQADNPGQWMLHCHNVYHGQAGMMTTLSYVE